MPRISVFTRFWLKVKGGKPSECWEWQGYTMKTKGGYGQINIAGEVKYAHRVSYEFLYGPIPSGMLICHRCNNPKCVNPGHLYMGTDADNAADKSRKDFFNGPPRFYAGEIWLMRRLFAAGIPRYLVARIFRCSKGTVSNYAREKKLCREGVWM